MEIVPYSPEIISSKELTEIFFQNYREQGNISSFNGVRRAMKLKYGRFTDTIISVSMLTFFLIPAAILQNFGSFSALAKFLIPFLVSLFVNTGIFSVYLVNRMEKIHLGHGRAMLSNLDDIKGRYMTPGGNFWIALVEDPVTKKKEVAGHLGLTKDKEEDLKRRGFDLKTKNGHLEMMGVNSEFRRLGIGKALMKVAIEFAEKQKFDSLTLGVLAINYAAIDLYKKFGFEIEKTFQIEPVTGLKVHMMKNNLNKK